MGAPCIWFEDDADDRDRDPQQQADEIMPITMAGHLT